MRTPTAAPTDGVGTTVLACLQTSVPVADGNEEVSRQRRFGGLEQAREWMERTIARLGADVKVVDISLVVESWRPPRSWETLPHRPIAQAVQVGSRLADGTVVWSDTIDATPRARSQQFHDHYGSTKN